MNISKIKNLFLGLIALFFMGCEGEQGAVGPSGINGLDGLNGLVNITNVPPSDDCENGGIKVDVGIDNNLNGTLESSEIISTNYVCNGVDGNTSLTTVTTEPASNNCENGGIKIDSGVDINGDGTLDSNEITATAYVCNGVNGNNGLIRTTNELAGDNCENGGIKIDSGIDSDANGTLDDTEITSTAYICNGIDGNNSLTKITNEASGNNCENGGVKIDSGVDTNGDGTLDDSEVTATAYVCNGIDGNNSLTKITSEDPGIECENGGLKINTGVDTDANGTLEDTEIRATAYVCNGVDGTISLVNVTNEDAGANCENGGVKIESGVDNNNNGTLDEDEVSIERYVCNGIDGGFDLQVRLFLLSGSVGRSTSGSPILGGEFIGFDKRNYIGVDSIIFSPRLKADRANNTVTVELYDVTNNRVIDNTALSTTSTDVIRMKSPDIFSDLPEEEIDLAVQISSENSVCETCGTGFLGGETYLILYRSN